MELKDTIKLRRSHKAFDPTHELTRSEIDQLMNLAILSPTAFNIQHWRFRLVTDKLLREEIKKVSWDQSQVTDASLLIVLTGDLMAWNKNPDRYWKNAPVNVRENLVLAISSYYKDKPEAQRDEVMRSCGMAAMNLMLVAKDLGYDSCPMDGFDFDAVAKLLNLPNDHIPTMFIAIGKSIQEPWPRPGQLPIEQVVQYNKFQ
ncbi:nitroreductase family protein [Methylophilaceae bacterium]|nr:nitroreductase family protein [Methylophilaceae bacterium]